MTQSSSIQSSPCRTRCPTRTIGTGCIVRPVTSSTVPDFNPLTTSKLALRNASIPCTSQPASNPFYPCISQPTQNPFYPGASQPDARRQSKSTSTNSEHHLVRQSSDIEEHLGRIQFSIVYNFQRLTLILKIINAVNLAAKDITGFSDPYVKVMLLPDKKNKLTTNIKRKNLNPKWNETLSFEGKHLFLYCSKFSAKSSTSLNDKFQVKSSTSLTKKFKFKLRHFHCFCHNPLWLID